MPPDSPLEAHAATPRELQERILAERRREPFLLYRDGDGGQRIVALDGEGPVTIGRRPGNDICLDWDSEVSRTHAQLERAGKEWTVIDDGLSHNGTWVGGERVTSRRRLRDGDVLAIGDTLIAYCIAGDASTVSTPTRTAQHASLAVSLTPAQRRVLSALCRPYRDSTYAAPPSNQQIADELFLTVHTVKGTLRQLFDVFDIRGISQNQKRCVLAERALQSGLISRREL